MAKRPSKKKTSSKQRPDPWMNQYHTAELVSQAEVLPLRRDMITLLTFVRDTKVIGTQGAGNMPLKAVREVTARFVNPPKLEETIGDRTYRLRSEANLWPLYFLHILAEVGSLMTTGSARRWQVTLHGESFLALDPLLQLSFLFSVWWNQVNWLVAYPLTGMGDALPRSFNQITLTRLRALPVRADIHFTGFADGLIARAGLTWTAPDSSWTTMRLRGSIAQMIVHVLERFGAIKCAYQKKPLGNSTISELTTFQITPLGKALLESLARDTLVDIRPRCGLCGKTINLTKTECCGQWICDDEDEYVMFSFARNSCSRNHRRYTLCGYHYENGHPGKWQDCPQCREDFETEMYVYMGTNEYNFEKLVNPPSFEPSRCIRCGQVISLGTDGYMMTRDGYLCGACGDAEMRRVLKNG